MARTSKVEGRREQILRAAISVFASKGFDRATNEDIAREAGVTPGLIYHYFDNKDDLLRAAIESYPARELVRTFPAELLELAPHALLRAAATRVLGVGEDEEIVHFLRIYLPEVIHRPELAASGSSTIQGLIGFLDQALAAKVKNGELRQTDTRLVAELFVGCLLDVILRRQILRQKVLGRYTKTEIVDTLVATMLEGLLPR